jgi:two-component system chemotaxis sensor kinase CheA
VLIEITDDGRGVNLDRVREVAARRQMMSPQALAAMSDAEATNLVFAPGFSTAEKVTELSGRGVGMDAVRTAITRVGGRVELHSTAGAGTAVRIVVPFSVMMTQVVTVEAVGQTFAIPLDAVVETLRIPADEIFPVGAANAIVLRDETVPLVRLTQMLGQGASMNATDSAAVVIAKVDGALGAFQVDRIGERMDIMLAPLEGLLAGLPGLAGSTLLGDGSVLLVLDLPELLQ